MLSFSSYCKTFYYCSSAGTLFKGGLCCNFCSSLVLVKPDVSHTPQSLRDSSSDLWEHQIAETKNKEIKQTHRARNAGRLFFPRAGAFCNFLAAKKLRIKDLK